MYDGEVSYISSNPSGYSTAISTEESKNYWRAGRKINDHGQFILMKHNIMQYIFHPNLYLHIFNVHLFHCVRCGIIIRLRGHKFTNGLTILYYTGIGSWSKHLNYFQAGRSIIDARNQLIVQVVLTYNLAVIPNCAFV